MNVPFNEIHPSSRIWIFQSNRKFTADEVRKASEHLQAFTARWLVHGSPMRAAFDIRYDQFIILAADEAFNAPSGCSIDDSVRTLRELESVLGTKLFDRQQAAFLIHGEVILIPAKDLKQKFAEAIWNEDTPSFNNLVPTRGQLETEWIIPAGKNWVRRYASARVTT